MKKETEKLKIEKNKTKNNRKPKSQVPKDDYSVSLKIVAAPIP